MTIPLTDAVVVLRGDDRPLAQTTKNAAARMRKAGQQMQGAGRRLSTFVTLPLAAVGVASIKMASDAEEAANKFNVVMGSAAERVRDRLQELTETIPLTRSEMELLAGGIQDLLVPMGVAREGAATMSAQMVELAGDLGSFNNVKPDQVLEAMKSALAGASEPMRRFGVDTRVARLEALALEAGLISEGQALDQTAMAQAVLLAITRDSTDAIGDARRTVDSTANSFKFAGRDARQMAITIGQILIPAVTPLVKGFSKALRALQQMRPAMQRTIVVLAAVAAAIGPLLLALGTIATIAPLIGPAFVAWLGPIAAVVAAVGVLALAAVTVIRHWDHFRIQFVAIWAAIKSAFFTAISAILDGMVALTARIPFVSAKVAEMRDSFERFAEESLAKSGRKLAELEIDLAAIPPTAADVQTAIDASALSFDTLAASMTGTSEAAAKLGDEDLPKLLKGLDDLKGASKSGKGGSAAVALDELGEKMKSTASEGTDAFVDFALGSGNAIEDFVKRAMAQLAKLILRMAFVRAVGTAIGGPVGGQIAAGIAGRQHGGPVWPNQAFVVGEAGPELFVPSQAGEIVSSGGLSVAFDMSSLPPPPRVVSPDALAMDAWWRRAAGALIVDYADRGGRF